jgi:hypothetical protein
MKRQLITLVMALMAIFVIPSSAQIAVGAKAGVNFNSFRQSESFKNYFDAIPGFNFGGYAKYPVTDFLSARAEVLYFQQGANIYDYRVVNELFRSRAKVRFHTFEIPVLAEFGIPSLNEQPLQPKLLVGGFYNYSVYTRESFVNVVKVSGHNQITYDGHISPQSQYNRSQYGLIAALAAEMKMFNMPVSIEFRYQYNLNRLNKPGTQNSYNLQSTTEKWGDELKLHTLSVNVGVTLSYF